jgi:hypothetical protein
MWLTFGSPEPEVSQFYFFTSSMLIMLKYLNSLYILFTQHDAVNNHR